MTATEFKERLANGDRLAVVMSALWKINFPEALPDDQTVILAMCNSPRRYVYSENAAHILAALASAEAKRSDEFISGSLAPNLHA